MKCSPDGRGPCLGDAEGVDLAFAGLAVIEDGKELVLRATLKTFVGQALLEVGDSRAVELLAEARREAEARHEVWWLSETIRLQALADRRFGDGSQAVALLDEAEQLATRQGARVILPRIAASR